jgi:hypothetical protein
MGPLGSGKTNASCWKAFRIMCAQEPNARGIRQTRIVAVRNTYPDLFGTTIKDWLEMFEGLGQFKQGNKEPPTHYIRFRLPDGSTVESEMIFMALDREDHVKKLRGLQATAAWVNEAKELPFSIVSMLDLRMGRFPKDVWPTWYGIFGDTNAPDTDHWYYRMAEEMRPEGWTFLKQPGGLRRGSPNHPWAENPLAENLQNLPRRLLRRRRPGQGGELDPINLANEYGYVGDGMPVHPDYATACTGDPAGNQKQAGDDQERTVFQILEANGVVAQPAPGNNVFELRCEAVNKPLRTMIDGQPQFQLHPDCRVTRKGHAGRLQVPPAQGRGRSRALRVAEAREERFLAPVRGRPLPDAGWRGAITLRQPSRWRFHSAVAQNLSFWQADSVRLSRIAQTKGINYEPTDQRRAPRQEARVLPLRLRQDPVRPCATCASSA